MDGASRSTSEIDWQVLSSAQMPVWLDLQTGTDPRFYLIGGYLRIAGGIDPGIFRRAVALVMSQHDALRLRIHPDEPKQFIHPGVVPPVDVIDLSEKAEPEAAFLDCIDATFTRVFEGESAPLFHFTLAKARERQWLLLIRYHHLIIDGFGISLMIRAVADAYGAILRGAGTDDVALLSYRRFLADDAAYLMSTRHAQDIDYWRERFRSLPEPIFPPRRGEGAYAPTRSVQFWVGWPRYVQFIEACRVREATPFHGLTALLAALLARTARRDDITIGVPILNRRTVDFKRTIGMFAGMMPLRLRIDTAGSVDQLVAYIGDQLRRDYRHQRAPIQDVQHALGLARLGRRQLFDVALSYEKNDYDFPIGDAPFQLIGLTGGYELNPLALYVREYHRDKPVLFDFTYNARHLTHAEVEDLARRFHLLFDGYIAGDATPIEELSLLSGEERRTITEGWNATSAAVPEGCLGDLFAAQAARSPGSVAVSCGGVHLSYGELEARSNRLARRLIGLGVGPETVVGLGLERSAELVVAMLAVLKAGGCYLPLDASHPPARLAFLLADAGAALVLTSTALAPLLPPGLPALRLDQDAPDLSPAPIADGERRAPLRPDHLAYIIYTSGSTGSPKGVAISHRSLTNKIVTLGRRFGVGPGFGYALLANPVFDPSVEQIAVPLAHGGRVVIVDAAAQASAAAFWSLIAGERVRLLNGVPAFLAEVLDGAPAGLRLEHLVLGGEAFPTTLLERIRGRLQVGEITNFYGPTEATIDATGYVAAAEEPGRWLPIGAPLPNYRVYVLDASLEPVPVGVAGEIYLGGVGLARGYVGRPDLTAERFVADPFGPAGGRLYRTGDLGRWRADGVVEFLGRSDGQVKLRGLRIEPGEIEAALLEHGAVAQAAVVVWRERLVAYVVARGAAAGAPALRAHLAARLPAHMLPQGYVFLAALPRTASGKLDRRALPEPVWREAEGYQAPQGAVEELLAALWAELLGLERVGRHDNFFALGGDSILSIQLVARARAAGVELTPRQIFQQPTLVDLAAVAGRRTAVADQPASYGTPVPLTPIQHRFLAQPGLLRHFNQAILLQLPPRPDAARLERALAAAAAHHDALRIRLFRTEEGWQQQIAPPDEDGRGPLLVHLDLSAASAAARTAHLEDAAARLQARLDPVHGPLWKAMWFDYGEHPGRLLIAIHHLAVDAVSWRILVEDIAEAYDQLRHGPAALPPRTTPFQSWAHLLAREAYAPATVAEFGYWRTVCTGACELPRDHAAPAENRVADSERMTLELDAGTTQHLLRDAPRAYHTEINDMLLTALALAVARWSETRYGRPTRELVIDLEGHGREDLTEPADLSRSVGWFTALFPVRLDLGKLDVAAALSAGAEAGAALKRVKEMLRAVPRKGIGFGLLSEINADTAPALAGFPSRQLLFNYLGRFDQVSHGDWLLADESPGPMAASARPRTHLIEANALVKSGRLRVEWSWCREVHGQASVAALAELFLAALRGLVAHCLTPGIGGHTPSDFPLAGLRQEELERIERGYPDLEAIYPLSPLQQGLLFHALYDRGADSYRVQLCLEIDGSLDRQSMREAWQRLLDRHESLRVAIIEQDGVPLQIVRHGLALPWREEDWSSLGGAAFEERLGTFLEEDRAQGFDFARGPLLRVALLRRSASRWMMVLTNHHLVLDGWSLSVLLNELIAIYDRCRNGGPDLLPAPRAYRDYLAWLARQDATAAGAYWRRRLAGAAPLPEVLDRPAGRPLGKVERRLTLGEEMAAELRGFVRRQGLTLGTLIHAAWALVLAQCTGRKDVVFGTTVAGRPGELAGIERMVGLFINTLPLRVNVERDAVVIDWLKELHALQLDDQRHGHASLAEIQRAAENVGGHDLFETLVVVENYPLAAALVDGNGVDGTGFRLSAASALERTHYPLTLIALPRHSLEFRLSFDSARVEEAGVARLLSHLERGLRFLAERPEGRLSELSLLSGEERRTITEGWNATSAAVPEGCLGDLFAAQAARSPGSVAVSCGGVHLSYGELEARSNRLARRLIGLGVGPETVVGLGLERSAELVVAMLAVLKAGGCYLPLDASHPPARLAFLLADAGAALVLTSTALAPLLPPGLPALRLDQDAPDLSPAPIADGERRAPLRPDHLAYIIYTSGSTGSPKGVAISHRSLTNKIVTLGRRFGVGPGFGYALLANPVFDPSVEQIAVPLAHGGRVVIVDAAAQASAAAFWSLIAGERVRLLNGVPAFLAEVLDGAPAGLRLEHLVLGGEAFPTTLLERIRGRLQVGEITNFYGPTEATIDATGYVAAAEEPGRWLPIGAPLPNYRVYVLDASLEPVPVGVAGEIYLGGVGLARGYVGRPDLTAERFVADPFGPAGGRLYRTGDLGRWRADGVVEFLGRSDGQVKLRGLRIEPGEIEAALLEHGAVAQAAVVVWRERLVAYVVARGAAAGAPALRAHLAARLPAHMLPQGYVFLAALPRTASGKLDRRALPEPVWREAEGYQAPQGAVEELLAALWAELLGLERVGRHDNFFDLGGHSLLATRLVSRVRGVLGVELALRSVFEHPSLLGLAGVVSGAAAAPVAALRAAARPAVLPLSFAQQRLWFLEQLEGGSSYTVPMALRLTGALDAAALGRALAEVVARHEALRTCFPVVDGVAVQSVAAAERFALVEEAVSEAALADRLAALSRRGFDLARELPIAATLLRLDGERHVLVVVVHHIAFDGWSAAILLQELSALYGAALSGDEPGLAPLAVQYADYALWQRRHFSGSRDLAYWRGALAGAPEALSLPTDRPRGVRRGRGASVTARLDGALTGSLRALARREGVTLFMVLQAALSVVLGRWSGQNDILLGTPVANRTRHEIEGLIGFFVNTLVLRTRLAGDPSVRALLSQVRETALGAFAHQELPFEQLVEELRPVRSLERSPLFQVMLVLQNQAQAAAALPGLEAETLALGTETAKFELTLSLSETASGLEGALDYDADLYDASTAARLLSHLERGLRFLAERPEGRLSELSLLSGEERRTITEGWNATSAAVPEGCLGDLFAAQAARSPGSVAVSCGGVHLSYGELEARSNRLARRLIGLGVGPETVVGLGLERSAELVVAMLAVLKAGGCYLPLDASHPPARLAFLLADAGAALVLTSTALAPLLPPGLPALRLDQDAPDLSPAPIADGERRAPLRPDHLAYIIYTSGSTGSPKGVAISHGAIVNHTLWLNRRFALGPGDRVLQKTALGFDASVWEFLSTLTAGATLVLAQPERDRDPAYLARALVEHDITVLQLVPSLLPLLLDQPELAEARSLRLLFCGGEALPAALVERCRTLLGAELHNLYGPTEATIDATSWPCAVDAAVQIIPLGRAISNMRIYVLDASLEPVPVGVAGEIYLGGAGLARGYVGRPDLTAERFVADPFGPAGGRLYRTGDLGRWRADGVVEFLGRSDGQVKLRGLRIEPGEIEAALLEHGAVAQAAVVVWRERLVAYVVARGTAAGAPALRAHLAARLPAHMLPQGYVFLAALPRTASGKLDRRALPEPVWREAEGYQAPQGAVEELLAALWAELLGLERVGRHDNFFDLGGHSLLATRLVSRVRGVLGVELALRSVFEHPSLLGLAGVVSGAAAAPVAALRAAARPAVLPLSFAQQRLWFLEQLEGGSSYTVPMALRLTGALDAAALGRALAEVVARHEALRTCFPVVDGVAVQSVAAAERFALVEEAVSEAALADRLAALSRRGFDLARELPIAATLLRLDGERHVLVVVVHHIAFDGWSAAILLQELSALYGAALSGDEPGLAPLAVQYADYALWQRRHFSGSRDLAYWRGALAGAPEALSLPTDRPRGVRRGRGASVTARLDGALTGSLRALARREGVTLFMVLQAALSVVLGRWSGQNDILLGTPVANRTRHEIEGLIGFFVNTLVLRTRLAGDPSVRALLSQVRETALGAFAHQELPFEQLVEELRPVRSLERSPLFQVMLVLQNQAQAAAALPGLEAETLALGTETAKFELTLSLSETASGLEGALDYDADLYDASTAARLLSHLERGLRFLAERPEGRLSELSLLSGEERRTITEGWNATSAAVPEGCLGDLFAAQAARSPGSVAVSCGGVHLSYGELEARSNRLARRLIGLGVGPETVVGLGLERSAELVVAMLAVLKAGGCYLPLDASHPPARLAFLLADAGAALVLTSTALAPLLPPGLPALRLDQDAPDLSPAPIADGERRAPLRPDHLAYIIYTSGSTGSPKGVAISHRSLTNKIVTLGRRFGVGPGFGYALLANPVFDPSVEQIAVPLAHGGRVVIVDAAAQASAAAFWSLIAGERVRLLNGVPAFLAEVLDGAPAGLRLEHLVLGGEAFPTTLLERIRGRLQVGEITNFYGPTEATIDATGYVAAAEEPGRWLPIGAPLPNYRVYVLDASLEPVPVGVAGEIYLGGVGLARGYVGRPDLTAERFVADPFGPAGGRLYRTGDLGRWRADGVVEFLGRSDGQVKLRGLRIEPGEIEAALLEHGAVAQAAVVVWRERLVAYVVARGAAAGAPALRAHLAARLPAHMLPQGYVFLAALPRTASGKLDRRALPEPVWREAEGYQAPQGAVEELLAALWAELLGLERVGRHDNFFDLGGHSLLATRLVSRVRGVLGVELALRSVFEHPSLLGLAGVVSGAAAAPVAALRAAARPAVLPLSFAQQRLWFLEQLEGGSSYTVPMALRLTGALDAAALGRALAEVVARHEALRTCFPVVDGVAVQSVAAAERFALVEEAVSEAALADRLAALSRRGFDLARELPIAATLLRLDGERHVLVVVVHHIAFDGWSAAILLQELSALYGAALSGDEPGLAPLAVQYADYALWQRRHFSGSRDLAYWRGALAGAPEALSLPTDRPRGVRRGRGASVTARLDGALTGSLRALARREGVTLFMVLQAALSVVLGRWSGQNDILLGTPVANRTRHEIEGLIGFFVNTLVLRTRLAGDPSVRALLSQVRETALGAFAHQELPFEQLVEELRPVRSLERSPLFQVMLVLQNQAQAAAALPGLEAETLALGTETAKFELTLSLSETASGLEGALDYDADLYDASTAARLLSHLERGLRFLAERPEGRLSELSLLSGEERRTITEGWNATSAAVPEGCLGDLFAAQAARSPGSVAVSCGGVHLSYGELEARSNRLARRLIGLGVGPETVVGLGLERSAELVVAMLAVLKAGGCYLPLDASHPPARLAFLLADAGAALVLTSTALAPLLPPGLPALRLDQDAPDLSPAPIADGERRAPLRPDHLAYIIYTSGSTGSPKGAMVQHRGVVNLALAHIRDCDVRPGDRLLQYASPAFDVSVAELWMALLSGATLVMAPPERLVPGEPLAQLMAEAAITHVLLVPSVLGSLPEAALAQCRTLVVGGEPCPPELVARHSAGRRMINAYGPTEATVCATMSAPLAGAETPALGRAISNMRIYVLDASLEPVPVGVAGEIYLGGAGLARGYVGRPDLTAERFVADPFGPAGGRLYRTGDLGRWRADGVVEFLGRSDGQVKLRGLRIEPGEIEAALLEHGAVAQAAVVVWRERLVAYVVARGTAAGAPALRAHLAARLPAHMLPQGYVFLAALPRTASGKLDRRALPEPVWREAEGYQAPQGAVEELLAALWAELLGLERVSRHDNFFDLGGHSLLAVQFVHRCRELPGITLSLRGLFEHPTLMELARHVAQPADRRRFSHLVPLQQSDRRPALFCVHPAGGAVFCYLPLAAALGRHQAVYGLQATGLDPGEIAAQSIEQMARDYLDEIRAIQPDGPYHLLGWSFGGLVAYEMACQLQAAGEEVALLALLDTPLQQPESEGAEITDAGIIDALIDVLGLEKIIPGVTRTITDLGSFVDAARHSGVWPADFSTAQAAELIELFKLNVEQGSRYRAGRYRGSLLLFRATETPGDNDRYFDWSAKVEGDIRVVSLQCTHNRVPQEPHVGDIVRALRPLLTAPRGFPRSGRPSKR